MSNFYGSLTGFGGGGKSYIYTYSTHFLVQAGGGAGDHMPHLAPHAGQPTSKTAGGGAGGLRTSWAGGSGGGGSSEPQLPLPDGELITITVGAGATNVGVNGIPSSITADDGTEIISLGGGAGAYHMAGPHQGAGTDGGCGGGGSQYDSPWDYLTGGSGTVGQGFKGGDGYTPSSAPWSMAGGGGTAAVGTNTSTTTNHGGAGKQVNIDGNSYYWGGGGGGASHSPCAPANGGIGGGGYGSAYACPGYGAAGSGGGSSIGGTGTDDGATNSGGGAGGANHYSSSVPNGGSGCVILRIATSSYSGTSSGAETPVVSGSDTILTWKGTGTYTAKAS